MLMRGALRQRFQDIHILKRVLEIERAQRRDRPVLSGVDRERVAGRHHTVAGACQIRIDHIHGTVSVVEIIAPLQEALDAELEELDAENAVSVLRKGKEAVADGFVLTAAVIGPLVFDRLPQERLDVVGSH